jgi:hypothetical protein
MYTTMLQCIIVQSPCFLLSLLLPIRLSLLTWNPPCCDRIRPPRSQVAHKVIFPFPSPCPYTPHSKIPTPRGLPDPNIHSLGRNREPGSQDPAHLAQEDECKRFIAIGFILLKQINQYDNGFDMHDGSIIFTHTDSNVKTMLTLCTTGPLCHA